MQLLLYGLLKKEGKKNHVVVICVCIFMPYYPGGLRGALWSKPQSVEESFRDSPLFLGLSF